MAKCQVILIDLLDSQHAQVDKENSELFRNTRVQKHCQTLCGNIAKHYHPYAIRYLYQF